MTNSNLHTVKMPRKCVAMPTINIVQLICKPETKKTATPVFVYRSLKLLTNDQVTSQRSQLKTYYIILCN